MSVLCKTNRDLFIFCSRHSSWSCAVLFKYFHSGSSNKRINSIARCTAPFSAGPPESMAEILWIYFFYYLIGGASSTLKNPRTFPALDCAKGISPRFLRVSLYPKQHLEFKTLSGIIVVIHCINQFIDWFNL